MHFQNTHFNANVFRSFFFLLTEELPKNTGQIIKELLIANVCNRLIAEQDKGESLIRVRRKKRKYSS